MARTKRQIKKRRGVLFLFLRLGLLISLFIVIVGGYWLFQLDKQVVAQFEGRKWAVPAHVFARPQELYSGLKLSRAEFVEQLERLGYRQVERITQAASYFMEKKSVSLITRPYQFWERQQEDLALRVEFNDDRIKSIINLRDSSKVSTFSLEPQLIGSLRPGQHEDRDLISINDVPREFILTLLATEDRKFLTHHGVDFIGIARAMVANLKAGRVVQGGSTITQQLVKNFYLSAERTIERKLKEMAMAFLVELHYEKHQILETYLNEVYLGQAGNRAIHGFELASKFYFGRPMRELDHHESALLVGLIKGPSYYNPIRNPDRATIRRQVVIDIMLAEKMINEDQAVEYKKRPLGVKQNTIIRQSAHPAFLDLVRRQLTQQYDEELLINEGMTIYTTMDLVIQQAADQALKRSIEKIEAARKMELGMLQGAVIVLNASTGEILALSSGRNSKFAGFNRALDAKRSIGSLVKPAVYLTAFEQSTNYTLMTPIADSPLTIIDDVGKKWNPGNYDKQFHGNVQLVEALARSYNVPAVRIGMDIGVQAVVEKMRQLGLTSTIKLYPSTLLGASQHTPLEMAQMYQAIANDGYQSPLRGILTVQSSNNEPIERFPLIVKRVATAASNHLLEYALKQVVKTGTARSLMNHFPADYEIAGKTGTTNDYRDSWFAGFSGDFVAIVWLGRDDNKPMGLTGSSGALKVWQELFQQIRLQEWPDTPPPDIRYVTVNKLSGFRTEPDCELAISIPFQLGTEPSQFQSCYEQVDMELPEVIETVVFPEREEKATSSVKDWFKVLFGNSDKNHQDQTKITNK